MAGALKMVTFLWSSSRIWLHMSHHGIDGAVARDTWSSPRPISLLYCSKWMFVEDRQTLRRSLNRFSLSGMRVIFSL